MSLDDYLGFMPELSHSEKVYDHKLPLEELVHVTGVWLVSCNVQFIPVVNCYILSFSA